ncbi:MAG: M48 family metallopeptidase [Cyanobacteria bacterium J06627_8]
MNFFEHQDQARRNTTRLVVLFGVAIASMILAFYIVAVCIYFYSTPNALMEYGGDQTISAIALMWQPGLFMMVAAGTVGFVGLGSAYKVFQLRGGGRVVAQSMGAVLVNIQTDDEDLRRLLNIVEEMAIASGVPVPPVYVMDESGINAFAAGFTMNDAIICVTRGCLEDLTRDELQGVIAHEFSHILNGDMRLNLHIVGILHGILIIHLLGRSCLRGGRYIRRKGAAQTFLIGLALTTIGGVGFLCGRLIKSAVSRQREFLADASAVQFTRNPHGISNALRKIDTHDWGSRLKTAKAEEASHMFFGSIGRKSFSHPFATHPPLSERIRRLESLNKNPEWMSQLRQIDPRPRKPIGVAIAEGAAGFSAASRSSPPPGSAVNHAPSPSPSTSDEIQVNPEEVIPAIGTTAPEHLVYAKRLLDQLSLPIQQSIRYAQGAKALIYALLLDSEHADVRDRQLQHLKQTETIDTVNTIQQARADAALLDPRMRLPLVDLAIPALRDLPIQELSRFFKQIQALVRADGRLSLSEYTLQVVLQQRLQPYVNSSKVNQTTIKHTTVESAWNDCLTVLSGLAQVGHTTADEVNYAFRSGLYRLPNARQHGIPDTPLKPSLHEVGASLKQLAQASPCVKKAYVDACAHTVLVDKTVTLREAELLRAIVISLGCPIPPFLDTAHGVS